MAFHDDCNEFGYSVEPDYDQCCDVEPAGDPNECDVRKFNIYLHFKYNYEDLYILAQLSTLQCFSYLIESLCFLEFPRSLLSLRYGSSRQLRTY